MAQSINSDNLQPDGARIIIASDEKISLEGISYEISLNLNEDNGHRKWFLLVGSFNRIQEDGLLLLKLRNDAILSFPCLVVTVGTIQMFGFPAEYYSSVYEISEQELQKISDYGIKKLRITDGLSYREKNWRRDKLGKFISKSRDLLIHRLENYDIRKNIYDNF